MKEALKKFWKFLHEDSWASLVVFLIIAFVILIYVFFPLLQFATGTSLPLVIVESCSMYHNEGGFERAFQSPIYEQNGIALEDTEHWSFQRGLTKGDIIFVIGSGNIEKGDVIIFAANSVHPIIHRVIDNVEPYGTKGDNHETNALQLPSEKAIVEDQLIGKAVFKIPYLGWIKLIFFDWRSGNSGLC